MDNRHRRGLVDGKLLKLLFGTATEDDIQRQNRLVDRLNYRGEELARMEEEHISLTREVGERLNIGAEPQGHLATP